MYVPVLFAYSA